MTGLQIGLFGYLLLGGLFPLRSSPRRSAFHLRNSSALAAFLILGPEALALILPSALLAALAPYRFVHLDSDTSIGRVVVRRVEDYRGAARAVFVDTAFLAGSLLLTHVYYGILLAKSYPVRLDRVVDLLVYLTVAFTASSLIALGNEIYFRLAAPLPTSPTRAGSEKLLPDDAPLYGLLVTIGTPLQLLAHVLYLSYGTGPFLVGMSSFVIFVLLHSLLLQRRARFATLLQDLEVSQRLAALGELTGRIVHQTRHQAGLIGITVHMVRNALDHSDPPPKEKIRKELDRLEGVAENLRQMLAGDLVEKGRPWTAELQNPTTLLGLVDREIDCLQAKARRRGVTVVVHGGEDADIEREPREVQRLSEGIFNVLENAISAAKSTVVLRIESEPPELLLSVSDDGDGIESSFLSRACEPFTTSKKEGTGMGLAIALSAARLWDGDLTLRNRPEGGLSVTFRLRPTPSSRSETEAASPRLDA